MAVSEDCASRSVLSSFTHGACRGNEHNLRRNRGLWGSSSLFLPVNSHSASAKSMLLGTHRQYSSTHSPTETKSQKMLYYLIAVVFGMVGLTYAVVPLYRTFCQATGYGGTVQRKEALYYRLLRRRLLGIQNLAPSLKGRLWCSSMLMLQIGCSRCSLQLKERFRLYKSKRVLRLVNVFLLTEMSLITLLKTKVHLQ